ncbi:RNA-directed DNA polymerase from mobile element jockey [Trichonephila clavata]|uniref:RNA-directed DNA polymerase from mobile element jockey n=1 Tax=Trichonephila clavata TaxID=2740835 RepID=A0A8X6FM64_TRICU|nr:RNA-directed DNA polymerase from mobile element jockey [Trichonephila clavata]
MTRLLKPFEHTASSVVQDKKEHVWRVSRGLRPKSKLQSTSFSSGRSQLRILQCNINGLCTSATRVKLDQLLDLANRHQAHIIAIQETKLKPTYNLKLREYCILRKDRLNKGGGGLIFLIRNSNFECVELPPFSDTELEVQAIKIKWNNKCLNIYNAYQPPGKRGVSSDTLILMFTDSSFILGDFNAKHPLWGSSVANDRGNELSNLLDDHAFCVLNDGTPTYCSHSYDSRDALDVSFANPDIFPSCSWTVLDSVGSDYSPVLIELSHTHKTPNSKNALFWNFKKANWGLYKSSLDNSLSGVVSFCDLDSKWRFFNYSVLRAACVAIPRGNRKKYKPNFIHNSEALLPLLHQRNALQRDFMSSPFPDTKSALKLINAKIKQLYSVIRRDRWNSLCEGLDSHTPNTKLWNLVKNIDRMQPQVEKTNTFRHPGGSLCSDNEAANMLGRHYQKESRLSFNSEDKGIAKSARDFIHKSRCNPNGC